MSAKRDGSTGRAELSPLPGNMFNSRPILCASNDATTRTVSESVGAGSPGCILSTRTVSIPCPGLL